MWLLRKDTALACLPLNSALSVPLVLYTSGTVPKSFQSKQFDFGLHLQWEEEGHRQGLCYRWVLLVLVSQPGNCRSCGLLMLCGHPIENLVDGPSSLYHRGGWRSKIFHLVASQGWQWEFIPFFSWLLMTAGNFSILIPMVPAITLAWHFPHVCVCAPSFVNFY